ncbi:armadillo-type protein [Roridomyces roridus]|uniref:Armadillo-type protein n=1 Tax=Roridomyces roridus TaxID=1738132 RepID=A0AAD7BJ76_9AGAR|nr:armadillo-type protein [Roridomyces roridus]
MVPLQRTDTYSSLHSWWSDSNSMLRRGPTINLHAATKPLMRLLYHKQALSFIAQNRHEPLSALSLEVYSSYLLCKYVSFSTQRRVLKHLAERAYRQNDAREILQSPVLEQIPQLLGSPDRVLRTRTSLLVGGLLAHKFSATLMSGIVGKIVPMLKDEGHPAVLKALAEISSHPDCAKAVFTTAFSSIPELLDSDDVEIKRRTCRMIEKLVRSRPIASILPAIPMDKVVELLQDVNQEVVHEAMTVLSLIAKHPDGAAAILSAPNFPAVIKLFDSKIDRMALRTCSLVDALVKYDRDEQKNHISDALRTAIAEKLLVLVRGDDDSAIYVAMRTLKTMFPQG